MDKESLLKKIRQKKMQNSQNSQNFKKTNALLPKLSLRKSPQTLTKKVRSHSPSPPAQGSPLKKVKIEFVDEFDKKLRMIEEIQGFPVSKYQYDVYDTIQNSDYDILIKAVAGSGKTTTLVGALGLIPKEKNVLLLSFNKEVQTILETALTKFEEYRKKTDESDIDSEFHIEFCGIWKAKTFHPVGYDVWREYLDMEKQTYEEKIIETKSGREVFHECKRHYPAKLMSKGLKKYTQLVWKDMKNLLGILKNLGYLVITKTKTWNNKDIEIICTRYGLFIPKGDKDIIPYMTAMKLMYTNLLSKYNVPNKVTFDDMLILPVNHGAKFEKMDVIFVDECQDLNPIQMEMIKRMMHSESSNKSTNSLIFL